MRRPAVLGIALVALLTVLIHQSPALRGAQDATPAASPVGTPAAGVSTVRLGAGVPEAAFPHTLSLSRSTFAPGASVTVGDPGDPDNPEGVFIGSFVSVVDAGSVVLTLEAGTAVLTRATDDQHATPTAAEANASPAAADTAECVVECDLSIGEEVVLEAGDSVFFENARFTLRSPATSGGASVVNAVLAEEESRCSPCPTFP